MITKPKPIFIVTGKIDTHRLNKVVKNINERSKNRLNIFVLDDKSQVLFQQE